MQVSMLSSRKARKPVWGEWSEWGDLMSGRDAGSEMGSVLSEMGSKWQVLYKLNHQTYFNWSSLVAILKIHLQGPKMEAGRTDWMLFNNPNKR